MLKLDVKQLAANLRETNPFAFPETSKGTSYLHNRIYQPFMGGIAVCLSDLDFSAFNAEDLSILDDLHEKLLGRNVSEANSIAQTLRRITPVSKPVAFI